MVLLINKAGYFPQCHKISGSVPDKQQTREYLLNEYTSRCEELGTDDVIMGVGQRAFLAVTSLYVSHSFIKKSFGEHVPCAWSSRSFQSS